MEKANTLDKLAKLAGVSRGFGLRKPIN